MVHSASRLCIVSTYSSFAIKERIPSGILYFFYLQTELKLRQFRVISRVLLTARSLAVVVGCH